VTDFVGIRARLDADFARINAQALAFNAIAPAELRLTGFDATPDAAGTVAPPDPVRLPDGISHQRADGAVRLVGYDRYISESLRSDDPKRVAWASQKDLKVWWFILDAMSAPGLTDETRFQIAANCSNAQQKMSFFGYDVNATDVIKRAASFEAWEFTKAQDPNIAWIEGKRISDAGSFPAGNPMTGVAPATAAEAEKYAEIHETTWIKGKLWGPGFGFTPKG